MTVTFDRRWIRVIILFQISLTLAAFSGGMLVDRWVFSSAEEFPVVQEAIGILQKHSLYDLPPSTQMEYSMLRGLVTGLDDPYASFNEPSQHELQSGQLEGQYGGIGSLLEIDSDGYFLLYPYPDSPAQATGIEDGDRLLFIDQWEIPIGAAKDIVEAALRGPEGEKVSLEIFRKSSGEQLSFTIRRVNIPLPSVTWNLIEQDKQVGIIRINIIARTTPDEITNAIQDLQFQGASFFILDLRNNAGGLVEAGVDIARLFLSDGTVMEQQYRDQPVKTFSVEREGTFANVPLVVLVNGGTASAAEIVAGALQAHSRAPLIGGLTYGKDTIQLVFDLSDQSSLHVTAARWWVPGITLDLDGHRLEPDILLSDDQIQSPIILEEAVDVLVQ
jgi:carboxyl-terminal processing protease